MKLIYYKMLRNIETLYALTGLEMPVKCRLISPENCCKYNMRVMTCQRIRYFMVGFD